METFIKKPILNPARLVQVSALLAVFICALQLHATTGYVSDSIGAPMRTGPSNAHRIVSLAVASGTVLEILAVDEASGFTQVRTQRGTEGWIRSQYISMQPIARDRLRRAISRMETTNKQLQELRTELGVVTNDRSSSQSQTKGLLNSVGALKSELAEIKRISAGALAMESENRKLTTLNERLRAEVDSLIFEKNLIQDNIQQKWLLIGAGLIFSGLLLGLFIKARPRRSGWS